jgi:multicomponent Na+:H+ antiporter subunit B
MSRRVRILLFAIPALAGVAMLVWAFFQLPPFGHYRGPYGDVINANATRERHATSAVTPVVFDYRGVDTIGEEAILFGAVMGVTVLLRRQREEEEAAPRDRAEGRRLRRTSATVRLIAIGMITPTLLLGLYVVAHGHLTPGGGFQGGTILAAAPILIYLAGRYVAYRRLNPVELLDVGEGTGTGGFVFLGFVGLLVGSAFLQNVFPLGRAGSLFSAGTMPVANIAVGLAVAAGLVLIVYEFLEQALMIRPH